MSRGSISNMPFTPRTPTYLTPEQRHTDPNPDRTFSFSCWVIRSFLCVKYLPKLFHSAVPLPSLLKRSCKRLAMGVGDSTCCAVCLKRPTSYSGIAFWLKGAVFSAILLP